MFKNDTIFYKMYIDVCQNNSIFITCIELREICTTEEYYKQRQDLFTLVSAKIMKLEYVIVNIV